MERKPENIHETLGELRRRVTELVKGDYSRGYKNAIQNIRPFIESYAPKIIVENLLPILNDLEAITEETYLTISDIVEEGSYYGDSKRDLFRREINNYKSELSVYINKYSRYIDQESDNKEAEKPNTLVLKYKKYNSGGQSNLHNLNNALHNYIDTIENKDFELIFSGVNQLIKTPINWNGDKYVFRYFLMHLFKHDQIVGRGKKRIDWKVVRNCFRYNKEIITDLFRTHTSAPSTIDTIDTILRNL